MEILAVGNINITIPGFFGPWSLKKMRDLQLKWPFLKVENGVPAVQSNAGTGRSSDPTHVLPVPSAKHDEKR